jgi:hypothetical protein
MPYSILSNSTLLEKVGKSELYGYLCVGLPLFSRDFLMHAYGADCLAETGKVVILGRSTEVYGDAGVKKSPHAKVPKLMLCCSAPLLCCPTTPLPHCPMPDHLTHSLPLPLPHTHIPTYPYTHIPIHPYTHTT